MPNTSHQDIVLQGASFAVFIPATYTAGEVSGVGTAIKLEALADGGNELTFPSTETENEVISQKLANGVTVEAPAVTMLLSAVSGVEKAKSGADTGYRAKVATIEADAGVIAELAGILDGDTGFLCLHLGEKSDGTSDGYAFLFCKANADMTVSLAGNSVRQLAVEFAGQEFIPATAFDHVDLNAAFGIAVDPMGSDAITLIIDGAGANAFIAGDVTVLKAGKILMKAAV